MEVLTGRYKVSFNCLLLGPRVAELRKVMLERGPGVNLQDSRSRVEGPAPDVVLVTTPVSPRDIYGIGRAIGQSMRDWEGDELGVFVFAQDDEFLRDLGSVKMVCTIDDLVDAAQQCVTELLAIHVEAEQEAAEWERTK